MGEDFVYTSSSQMADVKAQTIIIIKSPRFYKSEHYWLLSGLSRIRMAPRLPSEWLIFFIIVTPPYMGVTNIKTVAKIKAEYGSLSENLNID